MRVLNAAQKREADRRTIHEVGIAALVLMENAGRQVVASMEAMYGDLREHRVGILCGHGNNGGDGFVVARTLAQRGTEVLVFLLAPVATVKGEARVNLEILGHLGLPVVEIATSHDWELHASDLRECTLLVDAVFGTGFKGSIHGLLETVVADVNGMDVPVVSVDVPSGLSADSSDAPTTCIDASLTVALGSPCVPLVLAPAESRAGSVVIADIGIPHAVIDGLEGPFLELLTRDSVRALLPSRQPDAHKGDHGHVLVVAGSVGKTGAAHLAACGALRAGAGLVTVATPSRCQPVIAALGAEYMTEALEEASDGLGIEGLGRVNGFAGDVIVVGPGLGTGRGTRAFVQGVLERATSPLVLDADALNACVEQLDLLRGREGRPVIVTPHPGEMARLLGTTAECVQQHRLDVARELAVGHHVYVVLKGHRTLVATPEGRVFVNPTGNPGMATGGTGDVLAGMIGGLLGQMLDAEGACKAAVYLHGLAGDLSRQSVGEIGMTASDVLRHVPAAITSLAGTTDTASERRHD